MNFKDILIGLSQDKDEVIITFPNIRKVKAKIVALDLTNVHWKPVKVHFLDKGLKIEETVSEPHPFSMDQDATIEVKKMVPYLEDWIHLDFIEKFVD